MTDAAPASMTELVERYNAAWNAHDVEAILALHGEETTFRLHLAGFARATGRSEVRAQFEGLFATWSGIAFATTDLIERDGVFVHAYDFSAKLAGPFELNGMRIDPQGQPVAIEGVDVITTTGLRVAAKETYMDGVTLVRQLVVAPVSAAA